MSLDEEMREDLAGTTAICVIVKDQKLFCVNRKQKFFFFLLSKEVFRCRVMSVIVEQ
jgi:hypothetical protein